MVWGLGFRVYGFRASGFIGLIGLIGFRGFLLQNIV